MSDKSFNWKSLFINEEPNPNAPVVNSNTAEVKMPTSNVDTATSFPSNPPQTASTISNSNPNNPYLDEIFKVYESGFESLNQQGFDFFELYKSVTAVGIDNPQSYQMAFTMGKTINPSLTKDFLLDKANYYLTEIDKVYANYSGSGNSKLNNLKQEIDSSKQKLSSEVTTLEANIADLQKTLNEKKIELQNVEVQREGERIQIEQKIVANNLAKDKLVSSINKVILNVKQNL